MSNASKSNGMSKKRDRRSWFFVGQTSWAQSGMTLIELMIAVAVLAVGLLASMGLIMAAMQTDARNQTDTSATIVDQEVIEKFATLKNYPKPAQWVDVWDCSVGGASQHHASLGEGPSPAGNGAILYTAGTAPTPDQVGDIDWTQPVPALATAAAQGYAMEYQACNGDTYEVRWNVMQLPPNAATGATSHTSLLTVSTRQLSAVQASASRSQTRAILYARPVTLKTLVEN